MAPLRWLLASLFLVVPAWAGDSLPVSAEDALRWENLTLKIQLHESRVETIKRDVQEAAQRLAVERDTFNKAFEKSYGVPLERVERRGDQWVVKPEPSKAPTKEK